VQGSSSYQEGYEQAMMELIKGSPDNVVGVISGGTVTGEDYDRALIPAIHEKLKRHNKIRLLFQMSKDFSHLAYDAYLEDIKITWHVFDLERVAIVSDVHWINESVRLFRFMYPFPRAIFSNDELDKAKEWISE
jgi:hypothetical protein